MTLSIIGHRIFVFYLILKDRWRDILSEIKTFFQSIFLFIQEKSTTELLLYFGLITFLVWLFLYGYDYLKKNIKKEEPNQIMSVIFSLTFVLPLGGFFISIFLNNFFIFLYTFLIAIIIAIIEDLFFTTNEK